FSDRGTSAGLTYPHTQKGKHRQAIKVICVSHSPPPVLHTLSLHDALPIWTCTSSSPGLPPRRFGIPLPGIRATSPLWMPGKRCVDRKSTRLNSSHVKNSYAVFCLKKKNVKMKYLPDGWKYGAHDIAPNCVS